MKHLENTKRLLLFLKSDPDMYYTYQEIAEEIEMSVHTVRSILRQQRKIGRVERILPMEVAYFRIK
jgi:hypothetical protein